ncbi:hypothetical protein [Streptomyces sp. NPDC060194]|uniref:DoxX family protein n=1 Tax=Streptomyces sp. NPDC060194 TaxID=3347069 RepID=UPI00365EB28C
MPSAHRSALALAALLGGAGVSHLLAPSAFDPLVPRPLPGPPRAWTYGSGLVELALAAGLLVPPTRRPAASAAAAFFVGVLPGNVQMAYDWRRRPAAYRVAAVARLPLQVPLVLWARSVARTAPTPAR